MGRSEVFSFGTILWELAAHEKPFSELLPCQMARALAAGRRPPVTKRWPDDLRRILEEARAALSPSYVDGYRDDALELDGLWEARVSLRASTSWRPRRAAPGNHTLVLELQRPRDPSATRNKFKLLGLVTC